MLALCNQAVLSSLCEFSFCTLTVACFRLRKHLPRDILAQLRELADRANVAKHVGIGQGDPSLLYLPTLSVTCDSTMSTDPWTSMADCEGAWKPQSELRAIAPPFAPHEGSAEASWPKAERKEVLGTECEVARLRKHGARRSGRRRRRFGLRRRLGSAKRKKRHG